MGGGTGWLLLIVAAELERRNMLSYDGYNRLLAPSLLLFTVALSAAPRALHVDRRTTKVGLTVAAVGAGLLLVGNLIEFYGVLFQDQLNANAAREAGRSEHWIGSDIGWMTFGFGMLSLVTGGFLTALGLRRSGFRPWWVGVFAATLGLGVLAGNLFGPGPAFVSVPALGLYGAGWICFGILVKSRGG
ncbi:MAG: hypothetical protein M3345_07360 [Actinomycetota bacterium]|nr:hypothetical protein [Actinomycetota bacterium]